MTNFVDNGNWMLPPYQEMHHGQYLQSPNGRYRLVFQEDSNLVLYEGQNALWVADYSTPYSSGHKLYHNETDRVLIEIGRLSLYDYIRDRYWFGGSSTIDASDYDKVYGVLQDDGNVVVILFKPLFRSDPALSAVPDARGIVTITPNARLEQGRVYKAGDKSFVFQGDGNLVIYDASMRPMWNTGTQNQGADEAVMQEDGNFVIYNTKAAKPLWNSGTAGNSGAYAMVTDNGCFSVMTQAPIWARFGYTPTYRPTGKPDPNRIILGPFQVINWAF